VAYTTPLPTEAAPGTTPLVLKNREISLVVFETLPSPSQHSMSRSRSSRYDKNAVSRRTGSKHSRAGRLLEVGIVAAFLLVMLYVASVFVRVSSGYSETVESPDYVVRLQVLNGCGVVGLAARVADRMADYRDSDMEIKVVDTDNFEIRKVAGTFLISRREDRRPAEMLAAKLGLDPGEVVFRPLVNDHSQVSATLVLGEDFETIRLPGKSGWE